MESIQRRKGVMEVVLKCMGILLAWWVGLQTIGVLLTSFQIQNSDIILFSSQVIMLAIALALKRKNKIILNVREKVNVIFVIGAVFTGIGFAFFSSISGVMLILTDNLGVHRIGNITVLFIVFRLSAAVVEEFFYRGIMMNLCRTRFSAEKAVIITALLFAVAHIAPFMWIHTFVCGILCGYYYYRSGKIMIPIIIHFINNLIWGCLLPIYMRLKGYTSIERNISTEYNSRAELLAPFIISILIGIVIIVVTAIFVNKFTRLYKDKVALVEIS